LAIALVLALPISAPAGEHETIDRENTGINERDRDDKRPTAFDQGNSEADRTITAEIRKAVVGDDSLSMNAHNVKIITADGVVTLRGPVDSAAEKASVEAKAKSVAGVARVDSQLEVDTD
jgi:osmotically-inducible protein OsmY